MPNYLWKQTELVTVSFTKESERVFQSFLDGITVTPHFPLEITAIWERKTGREENEENHLEMNYEDPEEKDIKKQKKRLDLHATAKRREGLRVCFDRIGNLDDDNLLGKVIQQDLYDYDPLKVDIMREKINCAEEYSTFFSKIEMFYKKKKVVDFKGYREVGEIKRKELRTYPPIMRNNLAVLRFYLKNQENAPQGFIAALEEIIEVFGEE